MNKLILATVFATIVSSGAAFAGSKGAKAERVSQGAAEPADSTVPELSEIVVLCAQDEKKKFEKEWSRYVSKHDLKGVELQETIAWVSEEAATRRKKDRKKEQGGKEDQAWLEERRRLMSEIADRALNPAR